MTATAHAAVVVTAIVASIPTIITEAATLLPAAETVPQRAASSDCAASGAAGGQVHSDSGVLRPPAGPCCSGLAGGFFAAGSNLLEFIFENYVDGCDGASSNPSAAMHMHVLRMVCVNALLAWVCVLT